MHEDRRQATASATNTVTMLQYAWVVLSVLVLCLGESAGLIGETNLFPAGVGPNDPPNFCGKEKTVTGADGVERIYNVSIPTITPFLVSNSTSRSAVVVAPGGGYSLLAWNIEGTLIAKKFNDFGMNVFVLKYRVPARPPTKGMPKWWAPLQDAQRAMSWVRANSQKFNLNASRIGFIATNISRLACCCVVRSRATLSNKGCVCARTNCHACLLPCLRRFVGAVSCAQTVRPAATLVSKLW